MKAFTTVKVFVMACARDMAKKKIASLKKQIARLEKLVG